MSNEHMQNGREREARSIAAIDDTFVGEVIGVARVVDALRAVLNEREPASDRPDYEGTSALGYRCIAHNSVFLQRAAQG